MQVDRAGGRAVPQQRVAFIVERTIESRTGLILSKCAVRLGIFQIAWAKRSCNIGKPLRAVAMHDDGTEWQCDANQPRHHWGIPEAVHPVRQLIKIYGK